MILSAKPATAQDAPLNNIDPALEAQMVALEEATEALRGLEASVTVPHAFPSRDDVRAYIADQYREQLSPELAQRALGFYVALGLLPPDTDLVSLFIDVLGSQVAGFYDSESGVMNVVPMSGDAPDRELSLIEQIIYVHEYIHALQDQSFDLDALIGSDEIANHPDQLLAALSLVEGDATFAMTLYLQQIAMEDPMAALALLAEGLESGTLLPPDDIPEAIVRELLFPYEAGLSFAMSLYNDGGWEGIDSAYEDPPITSEHILHPDKYRAGEEIIPVQLAPIGHALGEEWLLIWDTRLGEYYLGEHLRTQMSHRQALDAAEGWGGDHFQVFVNQDAAVAWALKVAWDTPADAREFAEAYDALNQARVEADGDVWFGNQVVCFSAEQTICAASEYDVITSAPTFELAVEMIETQLR